MSSINYKIILVPKPQTNSKKGSEQLVKEIKYELKSQSENKEGVTLDEFLSEIQTDFS